MVLPQDLEGFVDLVPYEIKYLGLETLMQVIIYSFLQ